MSFSRQDSWTGYPVPPPGGLLDPRMEPVSPRLAGGFFTTEQPFLGLLEPKPIWKTQLLREFIGSL